MIINAHSYYSLRYGTLSVEELVAEAKKLGHDILTLTDINNSTGIINFVKACKNNNQSSVVLLVLLYYVILF